ncbi:hypothetical protein E2C01_082360 [Portunus trituberculatus]|uniref:Uncharacterized protein n=1 Tax=Portunus trituberculatus TaxID=210409 RepID=A0A5B7J3M0_PORTR|nr:hypothetical protein [Portunus trituberculatus]
MCPPEGADGVGRGGVGRQKWRGRRNVRGEDGGDAEAVCRNSHKASAAKREKRLQEDAEGVRRVPAICRVATRVNALFLPTLGLNPANTPGQGRHGFSPKGSKTRI